VNINKQKINEKYLKRVIEFFKTHTLGDFDVIYSNEEIFRKYLNVSTFKFTNSATSALLLIFKQIQKLLNKKNLTVIGPAFTHPAWINVCNWLNLNYDFIDVSKYTTCVNPSLLASKLKNKKYDVIVFVDMLGYIGEDSFKVKEIAKENNCILVEDSAAAFAQTYKNTKAGTVGDFSIFSFSNPKLLSSGEGGAIVSKDYNLNDEFENMIFQAGWYKSYRTKLETLGLNFGMSNWITELLKYQLEDINSVLKAKHELYVKYKSIWKDKLIDFPSDLKYYSPSVYVVYTQQIDLFLKTKLFEYKLNRDMSFLKNVDNSVSKDLENHLLYLENY